MFLAIDCATLQPLVSFVKLILEVIKWVVPIVIIIIGTIDLFKAVIASKEDEIKAAQKLLIKRVIYGLVIFFIGLMVQFIFGLLGDTGVEGTNNLFTCWNQVK